MEGNRYKVIVANEPIYHTLLVLHDAMEED